MSAGILKVSKLKQIKPQRHLHIMGNVSTKDFEFLNNLIFHQIHFFPFLLQNLHSQKRSKSIMIVEIYTESHVLSHFKDSFQQE